jgi:hypothetical protein
MTPDDCLSTLIRPALQHVRAYDTPQAEVMLLAIALQESGLATRVQDGNGPAHGFWQFELPSAVVDFVRSGRSDIKVEVVRRGFPLNAVALWRTIEVSLGDAVACLLARDRLYRLIPEALPELGDLTGAWQQYVRAWGPGKPSPARWDEVYPVALETVQA